MKKQLLAMLSLLIALAMLAACGSTGTPSAQEASSAPAETAEAVETAAESDTEAVLEEPAAEQSAAEEEPASVVEEPEDTYVDEGPFDQPEVLSVKAIGCVDVEGPKLRAVAVEYGVDLAGAEIDETTYELSGYFKDSVAAEWNNGDGQVGDITRVYINDRPAVDETGKDSGRFAIITFHSMEDRIVKEKFKTWENPCTCPKDFPVCICGKKPLGRVITKKPVTSSEDEIKNNRRAHSCKLRIFERKR